MEMKEFENSRQCSHSQDVISYVYNEMPDADRVRFDGHLAECNSCIEELAELSLSYYSVYEWRKVEFDPLPTPYFELPRAEGPLSLIERFRAMFLPSQTWVAAGSFAAILLIATAGLIVFNGSNNSDLASISNVEAVPANDTSSIAVPAELRSGTSAESNEASVDMPDQNNKVAVEPAASDKRLPVKPQSRPTNIAAPAPAPVQRRTTAVLTTAQPQLTEFDEVQDDSLRLSDILDEIDTGD